MLKKYLGNMILLFYLLVINFVLTYIYENFVMSFHFFIGFFFVMKKKRYKVRSVTATVIKVTGSGTQIGRQCYQGNISL